MLVATYFECYFVLKWPRKSFLLRLLSEIFIHPGMKLPTKLSSKDFISHAIVWDNGINQSKY
jgi:hypothetical protein